MSPDYFKEPYEIIEKKLELAELTLELGMVTQEKWKRLETMKDVLQKEEYLIKNIAEKTNILSGLLKKPG